MGPARFHCATLLTIKFSVIFFNFKGTHHNAFSLIDIIIGTKTTRILRLGIHTFSYKDDSHALIGLTHINGMHLWK